MNESEFNNFLSALKMAEIRQSEKIDFSPLKPTAIECAEFLRASKEILEASTDVARIGETLKEIDLNADDFQEKNDSLITALDRLSATIATPDFLAWTRIVEIISIALTDPIITKSKQSVNFLNLILQLTDKSFFGQGGAIVALDAIESEVLSNRGRVNAKKKHENLYLVRDWVISEWESRQDRGQSKAAFARDYVYFVKKKFRVIVTTDTISRNWLPSEKTSST